eukprot:NODE_5326_length_1782_cov_28.306949.p1 GENE.NODE_5326_length_1782_cov_28.306949~~NODE_5326_length_1782_cov_28.306949.p1  ORF type:complete len:344 (+),score=78.55 NODE_5326_length_1782_cov_28.306949:104-1135(+)
MGRRGEPARASAEVPSPRSMRTRTTKHREAPGKMVTPVSALRAKDIYRTACEGGRMAPLQPPPNPVPIIGHWSAVLQVAVRRLNDGDPTVLQHFAHRTDEFALLFDGHPKSHVHLLAMPRHWIEGPAQLTRAHLPMLLRLSAYVSWVLEELAKQYPDLTWRHGVHSTPTLLQLHVHVMSQDFRSPSMKQPKHFNSFQSPFLVPLDALIAGLKDHGYLQLHGKDALNGDMWCCGCGANFGSRIGELKVHLNRCRPPRSAPPPLLWRELVHGGDAVAAAGGECGRNAGAEAVVDVDSSGHGAAADAGAVDAWSSDDGRDAAGPPEEPDVSSQPKAKRWARQRRTS